VVLSVRAEEQAAFSLLPKRGAFADEQAHAVGIKAHD
jgi:hypothetical protein